MCETLQEFIESACQMGEGEAIICLLFIFQPYSPPLPFLPQQHSISYNFSQILGHVLCYYLYCTFCLESLFFCFSSQIPTCLLQFSFRKLFLTTYPQEHWFYTFTHLISIYWAPSICQLLCWIQRNSGEKKRCVLSWAFLYPNEGDRWQTKANKSIKETICHHWNEENKHNRTPDTGSRGKYSHGSVFLEEGEVYTKSSSCSCSTQYFSLVLPLSVVF